jgi:signal transduction histidine kinase
MMSELSMHIIDIIQNSMAAQAKTIHCKLKDSLKEDIISILISDDGRGMTPEEAEKVQDPFYTSKKGKRVGLGIPLFKAAAIHCQGNFSLASQKSQGTQIQAVFKKSHIDTPPLGDMATTIHGFLTTVPLNMEFEITTDSGQFTISTAAVKEQTGDLPLTHPEVSKFLRTFITSEIQALYE